MTTLRKLTRGFKYALFYFQYDRTLVVMPTKKITDMFYEKRSIVLANCDDEKPRKARIIELSDNENFLRKIWNEYVISDEDKFDDDDDINFESEVQSTKCRNPDQPAQQNNQSETNLSEYLTTLNADMMIDSDTENNENNEAVKKIIENFDKKKKPAVKRKPARNNKQKAKKAKVVKELAKVCGRGQPKQNTQNDLETTSDEVSDVSPIFERQPLRKVNEITPLRPPQPNLTVSVEADVSSNEEELHSQSSNEENSVIASVNVLRKEYESLRKDVNTILLKIDKIYDILNRTTNVPTTTSIASSSPVLNVSYQRSPLFEIEKENIQVYDELSPSQLENIKNKAVSVQNFALKCAENMFTEYERKTSNCAGTKGKSALNRQKLERIRTYVFYYYPCPQSLQNIVWNKCISAINEGGRRK